MPKLNEFLMEKLNLMGQRVFLLKKGVKERSPNWGNAFIKVKNGPSNLIAKFKKQKSQNKKKKTIKDLKKSAKKLFKKKTVVKVIIIIATASMLLPLILPFLG